jgi:hypothetical protein
MRVAEGNKTSASSGFSIADVVETIRSEPVLSWFAAQALWIAQPALEAFWPAEKIAALAEGFDAGWNGSAEKPGAGR